MMRRLPHISAEFSDGKWQGVSPRELDFGDLCYVSRRGQNAADRKIAWQEIFRRLRAAKQRRFHDRNDSRQNGRI
jgi:hypothetical protein